MAHLRFVHHLDEGAHTLGLEAHSPFEVSSVDGPAPCGGSRESHGGVVKLDELIGAFALVDTVGKEGRHLNLVFCIGIIGDDVVGAIFGEGDAPHIGLRALPALDDGITVVSDVTAGGVE